MRVSVALVISSATLVLAADKPCTARANGQYFDLSRLMSKTDYKFKLPNGSDAAVSVCGPLTGETWGLDEAKDLGGRVRRDHGDFSLGKYNETLLVKDGMPMLVYENGSKCPMKGSDMKGSTIIRFICDKNVYAAGTPQLIAQYPSGDADACAYFFSWRTHLACPTSESSWSGFGSFLYILFMGFLSIAILYIIVGICYRRYALNLRGADVLQRFGLSSIREVFEFCKDALEDLFQRRSDPFDRYGSAWSGWRTQSSGREPRGNTGYAGYRNVPSHRDEEEAILGEESEDEDEEDEEEQPAPQNARPGPNAPSGGFVRPGPQAPGPAPWNDQANVTRPAAPAPSAPGRPPVQGHSTGRPAAPPAGPSPWSDQANVPQRAQPPPPQTPSGGPPPPPSKGDSS